MWPLGKALQKGGCRGRSFYPFPVRAAALAEGLLCFPTASLGAAVGHCARLALPAVGCPAGRGDRQGLG